MRTVRYVAGAVAVCLLAAVEPASAQQLNYVGQTDVSVEVSYSNLPAGTELLYVNEVTGTKGTALASPAGGSGTIALPMPPGPGRYSIMARKGGDWLAQTVVFYSKDPAPAGETAPSGSWSVTITINGQVTNFSGGATDGNVTYSTPPPPPTNYLLDDMQGYMLDSTGAKLTTSP